jgi:hypothetical protein
VISKLEALGLTHIWEHLAVFSSLVLLGIWRSDPKVRIPDNLVPDPAESPQVDKIDFLTFIQGLDQDRMYTFTSIKEALLRNEERLLASQIEYLNLIFDSIQDISRSPILPIMQEFVLGSERFNQIFQQPAKLNIESYPCQFDRAVLTGENRLKLLSWMNNDHHHASIFTNRPDAPGLDFFSSPEAELGIEVTGLANLPLVGAGSMDWLAISNNQSDCYYKPHPIHSLTAMLIALDQPLVCSLSLAYDFVNKQEFDPDDWRILDGATMYVFEDSKGGLESVRNACGLLKAIGITIDLHLIGVSIQKDKIRSLQSITDQVYPDLNASPLKVILEEAN